MVSTAQPSIDYNVTASNVKRNIHILVHCENTEFHGKKVVGIGEMVENEVIPIFEFDQATGLHEKGVGYDSSSLKALASKYRIETSLWS